MQEIESHNSVDYMRSFTQKKLLIFLVTVTTTLISVGITKYRVPIHTGTAILMVAFYDPVNTSSANAALPAMLQDEYMATQIGIISSKYMAEKVQIRLDFERDPVFYDILKKIAGYTADPKQRRSAISRTMLAHLNVYVHNKRTRLIKVAFENENPEVAVKIANAFAQSYIDTALELNLAPIRSSAKWIEKNTVPIRESLNQAEEMLSNQPSNKEIDQINNLLNAARYDLNTLMSILDQDAVAGKIEQDSQYIFKVRSEILENELVLIEKSRTLGERDEEYKSLKVEATYLKNVFLSEVKKQIEAMKVAMDSVNRSLAFRGSVNQSSVSLLSLADIDVSSDNVSLRDGAIYGAILGLMLGIIAAFFSILARSKPVPA